jgi:hypothetical protein
MRRSILIISIISLFLISACGQRGGNSPLGVTGGGDDGYGSYGSDYDWGYYYAILGSWQHDQAPGGFEVVTFSSEGVINVEFFDKAGHSQLTEKGSYLISGKRLYIKMPGWNLGAGTFEVADNLLVLNKDGDSISYKKIQ